MADDEETAMMTMSPEGCAAFEALQDVMERHNLRANDGLCVAGDFLTWVLLLTFRQKDDAKLMLGDMVPGILLNIDANWDGLQARREVIDALERGQSGGRLQ